MFVGATGAEDWCWRVFARTSQSASWALKSAGPGEPPAGQERGLQIAVGPLDQALGFRVPRPALDHRDPQRPPEPVHRLSQHRLPGPPLPDRELVIPDQSPRDGTQAADQGPVPGQQISPAPAGRPACPAPSGTSAGGNHRSHCASSPGKYSVRNAGSPAAAPGPRPSAPSATAPSRSAPRSPSPAYPATAPAAP